MTPITPREPRPLPDGLALYYSVWPCTHCDSGPSDLRRVVFDEAVGAFREDRPLAFFDGAHDNTRFPVAAFRVSEDGQTLAATICHAGLCGFEYPGEFPSADSKLRLWVSNDGGRSWDDWGKLLPMTEILEVTDDDVLVRTRNIWHPREDWGEVSDEAWESMLARLAALGLDELEGWEEQTRWVASGETYSPPSEPAPPTLGGVDWRRFRDQPEGAVAWAGSAQDKHLLAIANEAGSVDRVYGAEDWLWGSFIASDAFVRPVLPPIDGEWVRIATLELVDLASASIHEVKGLALPLGFDPKAGESQQEFYHFITARPAPTAAAQAALEYTPLTLGDPRELPVGVGLYFADWPYEGFATDVTLGFATGDGFVTERLWAVWDDSSAYVTSFRVSDDSRTMAAAVCEQGYCEDCYSGPTEDASLRLRVWRESTFDWEDWGELPQGSYIEGVTADDVAITAWLPDPDSHDSRDHVARLWWFRSGQEVEPPAGLDPDGVEGWHWRSGGFLWDYGGDAYVTDSGTALLPPPDDASAPESARWYLDEVRGDGTALWSLYGADEQRFALVGEGGEVVAAFTWDDASEKLHLAGFVSDDLVVGQIVPRLWHTGTPDTEPPTTVLVDLANHSVHPVTDLDDVAIDDCLCLWFVRSQP